MRQTRFFSSFKPSIQKQPGWKRSLQDTLLALVSISILTIPVFLFNLSTRVPDCLLLYLLVVLALASMRGRYAALLASLVAFFSFDFLFVPPLYSLIITKYGDFLTLIVFLVTAIITSQLTSALRRYAAQASRRERETRILYDLVRATNYEEDMERQLQIFVDSVTDVFSVWGVRACLLLLPDAEGKLTRKVGSSQSDEEVQLLPEEEELAACIMLQARTIDIPRHVWVVPTNSLEEQHPSVVCHVRLMPLQREQQVLGVLRLSVEEHSPFLGFDNNKSQEDGQTFPQAVFFRTFLEQAVALIERGRLQRESLRIKVLQQTDLLRAALLSSVSHDLRSPLSAIMTAATSLQQKETQRDEEAREGLAQVIEHEAQRLNRLVANLLDMSRIEGGALHPRKVWYPLDDLIHDALARLYPLFQGRPLQLNFAVDLPPVKLDQVQIDQVMTNLIENTLRYTPAGSPLEISIEAQGEWIQVSIADRGPGIPVFERELIFDKFYRVQRAAYINAPVRGSGLGLSICRGLIEAHGGRIWVEPRDGGGAVFCFTLPQQKMEEHGFDEEESAYSHR